MIKKIFSVLILSITVFCLSNVSAQTGSFGNTYIPSASGFPVFGELHFNNSNKGENPGVIYTNKGSVPGLITFFENASWSNANDFQHIDGFVKSNVPGTFTFPIGDLGFYRPIIMSSKNMGNVAAYFLDNPLKNTSVVAVGARSSTSVASEFTLSDSEYWQVGGTNPATITLTYDLNSSIADLTEDELSRLEIMGWNGDSWEVIPSEIDEYQYDISTYNGKRSIYKSDSSNGSISTINPIIPDDYHILTFGVQKRSSEATVNIEYNTSIVQDEMIEFTLFPNPTLDLNQLKVDYELTNISKARLEIYNSNAQLLYQQKLEDSKDILKLPFSENISGTYYLGIVTESGSKLFKPVIVTGR